MEPRIQYAQTKDGVSIAFYTLGEGTPLVVMPTGSWSHIQLEWQFLRAPRWFNGLAQKRMLVRYDCRGSGLSDRDVADFSLDAHVLDVAAGDVPVNVIFEHVQLHLGRPGAFTVGLSPARQRGNRG